MLGGAQSIPLFKCLPEYIVAHHDRVDNALIVESVLVLTQDTDALWLGYGSAVGRLDLAGEYLHERALAGAVRTGKPVAVSRSELDRDVIEQHPRAVGFGDFIDYYHGVLLVFRYSGIRVFGYSGVQVFRYSGPTPHWPVFPEYPNT